MDAKTITLVISGLFGGLGLFLYGMTLMSEGLQKTAGDRMKLVLEKLTINRYIGALVGAGVTVLIQSSSATTVMVVGFVNAGMMNLTQALSIILGANIGTTITAQIIAFKVTALALPAIGFGAVMLLFIKKPAVQYIGQIVFGFGLLFFGMSTMTAAFTPLNESESFRHLFVIFSDYPILAVVVGALTTLVVQSSSATIGITIALATTGLVDFPAAVALTLGDNIGTTVTANLAALNGSRTAKQAAFGHFLFNFLGVCIMMVFLKPFMAFINFITPGDYSMMAADGTFPYMARHIANAHTFFNVIAATLFLPVLPLLAKICEKVIKTDKEQSYKATRLSDAMLSTPEIAASQVRNEVGRMSTITLSMLKDAEQAIQKNDKSAIHKINEYEETLDGFRTEILNFIEKLQRRSISKKAYETMERLRQVTHALEEMGDQSVKLMKITFKMLEKKHDLSKVARKELDEMFGVLISFASLTFRSLYTNRVQTEEDLALEDELDRLHKQFRKNHIKRLNRGACGIEIGIHFVDILNYLEKMGDHIFTIAQINLMEHHHERN